MVDWKKLEDEVDTAINKDCHIDLESKEPKECKYIQKVAEDRFTVFERKVNLIIFVAAIGASLAIPVISTRGLAEFYEYVTAIVLFVSGICWGLYLRPRNKRCRRIILDAEQKILSGESEPNQPQEPTTTPPQAQENMPHKGANTARNYFLLSLISMVFFQYSTLIYTSTHFEFDLVALIWLILLVIATYATIRFGISYIMSQGLSKKIYDYENIENIKDKDILERAKDVAKFNMTILHSFLVATVAIAAMILSLYSLYNKSLGFSIGFGMLQSLVLPIVVIISHIIRLNFEWYIKYNKLMDIKLE